MTKHEALRLALEALEGVLDDSPKVLDASISGGLYEVVQCRDAITAIKAALEAKDETHGSPCPEFWDWLPKAYRDGDIGDESKFTKYNMEVAFLAGKQLAASEAKDEPVAWRYDQAKYRTNDLRGRQWAFNVFSQAKPYIDEMVQNVTPLYTTPPQRTWVGLTDEEANQLWESTDSDWELMKRTEAKLKEKNT